MSEQLATVPETVDATDRSAVSERLVCGLDLSLRSTGVATSDGHCYLIRGPQLPKNATYRMRCDRIWGMREEILDMIYEGPWPALIVIEGPAYRANDPSMFDRAALWHGIYHDLVRYPVAVMSPATVKKYATGRGNATKGALADAVTRRWPSFDHGGDDNLCDAVALMAAGRDWLGQPLIPMPKAHRDALTKADWPEVTR